MNKTEISRTIKELEARNFVIIATLCRTTHVRGCLLYLDPKSENIPDIYYSNATLKDHFSGVDIFIVHPGSRLLQSCGKQPEYYDTTAIKRYYSYRETVARNYIFKAGLQEINIALLDGNSSVYVYRPEDRTECDYVVSYNSNGIKGLLNALEQAKAKWPEDLRFLDT